jgi:uncharacterized protein (TIGR02271 family)
MARKNDPEKTVDLPPEGRRNPDPVTDQPGSHPIETGIGAAVGGAASGLAVGAVAGPIGAAVGAAVGAVAGGLAGKGVGEVIDPTTEDNWLRDSFESRPYVKKGETYEKYREAYRYGGAAVPRYDGRTFDEVEDELKRGWGTAKEHSGMTWGHAREAVRDAYDRTIQLREERLKVAKTPVQTGEVRVRKEVHTETRHIDVPVEREEVVIDRRPASGRVAGEGIAAGDIGEGQEVRIPVREEQVNVSKEAVVTEEVSVGKRVVRDTERVSGDVRKEEVKVEQKGDVDVRTRDSGGSTN